MTFLWNILTFQKHQLQLIIISKLLCLQIFTDITIDQK